MDEKKKKVVPKSKLSMGPGEVGLQPSVSPHLGIGHS